MHSKLKISLIGWLLAACTVNAIAQQEYFLSWDPVGEKNGLNALAISDIYQDSKGFLWLGTWEGLVRFDGHAFRYFRNIPGDSNSIYSNNVRCITEDAAGNIWVGLGRGGVSRYDRKTGQFRNYPFTEKLNIKTSSIWRIFFDSKGEAWVGLANYGMVHLDKETGAFRAYDLVTAQSAPHLTPEEIQTYNAAVNFWEDEAGIFWIATSNDLYQFNPKTGTAVSHRFNKRAPNGIWLNEAFEMYPEGDGLWVVGWASGLRYFNRKTGEWKQYLLEEYPLSSARVNVIHEFAPKGSDEFWIASEEKGLCIFDKKTGRFTSIQDDKENYPDFPGGAMIRICVDRQGNVWLNNENKLLRVQMKNKQFVFNPVTSKKPTPKELAGVSGIFEDREGRFRFTGLWGGDALHVFDKKTGKTSIPQFRNQAHEVLENQHVRDMLQAKDGTIWVLSRHFLYRFNPATLELDVPAQPPVYSPESGSNFYFQLTEDGQGDLWLGSALYGAFQYKPATGTTVHFMPDSTRAGALPSNILGRWRTDRLGRPWYGGSTRGTYGYYLASEDRFVYLDANGKVTTDLTSMQVNGLFPDKKGDMWICSEQGLLHFDCSTEPAQLLKKYTLNDGLPSDYVTGATEDDAGDLWIIAGKNLCKLDVQADEFTTYGKKDGYPANNIGIGKLQRDSIFLLTHAGYYAFSPDSFSPIVQSAPVVLTSFRVNDEERHFGSELSVSEPLIVPADGRYFSLEFASLDLAHPELSRYEYRLEGLDHQWVKSGSRRLVNYTNVPAGQYFFKVKPEGRPDSEALVVPLVVHVAFYKTSWFWALVLMAVLAVGFAYYRNRQLQKQELLNLQSKAQLLEKEKALMQYESLRQQLNPHFLFNSLTSLGSLISIDPKGASAFLDSLSKTYRYILKSSELEVVPLVEELKFGASFVNLQKTRFGEGLQVNFRVDEADFHRKIVPVTLQNLIENAIKHNIIDLDEPLVIDVWVTDGYLVVRNNLQKKKFVETSNKRGLANLKSFYKYLSEKPIVVEEDGAFFTIKIPLI